MLVEETPDIALEELRAVLAQRGVLVGYGTLWHFFHRHEITRKKTAHASEQNRPDILKRREVWFEAQLDLDPEWLAFVDETWAASTNMARRYGRAPRGRRLRVGVPHGH